MKNLILILIATQLVASSFAFNLVIERIIDHYVENEFMRNNQIPGVGLAVVRNGTVLMSKGYGMRNITAGLTTDGNTLFSIATISQSFIAVLVVKTLNELYPQRGAAVLDVPIAELIPSTVNFTLSDRYRAEHTTFRDILSHRTCLLNGEGSLIFGTMKNAEESAFRSRFLPQVCEFRNGFLYNINMLSLAGELISAIAGTKLQNMILSLARDIGMTNTTYVDIDGAYESLPDMSQPYMLRNESLVEFDIFQIRRIHVALGAGGILSSANDMAKYMEFHLSQGRVGNREIVPRDVMSWLYRTSIGFDFRGGRNSDHNPMVSGSLGVGLGHFLSLYNGWNVIHLGGYYAPYHCIMHLFPATSIGVFICSNGPGAIMNYPTHADTALNIFELVRGSEQSFEEIATKNRKVGASLIEDRFFVGYKNKKASTALHRNQIRNRIEPDDVVGVYGHPYDGDLHVRYVPGTNNSTLQLYLSEWAHGRLQRAPGSNTIFSVHWDTTIMDTFYSLFRAAPNVWIDFGIVDSVFLRFDIYDLEFQFFKNATRDTFPAIPWPPTSCGPQ